MAMMLKAIAGMGKIKASQWKSMHSGFNAVSKGVGGLQNFAKSLGVLEPFIKGLNKVLDVLGKMIQKQLAPILQEFYQILFSPEVMELMEAIATIITALFIPALKILMSVLQLLIDTGVLQILTDAITLFAEGLAFVWEGVFSTILPIIQEGFKAFGNILKWVWETLIKPFFDFFKPVLEFFAGGIQNLGVVFEAIGKMIHWVWNTLIEPVFGAFADIFRFIGNVFIGFINMIIDVVNFLTLGTAGLTHIPLLDSGGIVRKTGLAIVSENEEFSGAGAQKRPLGTRRMKDNKIINVYIGSVKDEGDIRKIEETIWQVS